MKLPRAASPPPPVPVPHPALTTHLTAFPSLRAKIQGLRAELADKRNRRYEPPRPPMGTAVIVRARRGVIAHNPVAKTKPRA
ncbi:hypothetical protein EVAR_49930_1 [Eumeta japonica]|uniref:Uncharacterized protein n=1 Tax=Eumeta variegata TaxID=151549 RepID=A0A4C1XXP8_EUMVA|nr:hypothetical protein EVAR_49930_1 [Eumeta japonica]